MIPVSVIWLTFIRTAQARKNGVLHERLLVPRRYMFNHQPIMCVSVCPDKCLAEILNKVAGCTLSRKCVDGIMSIERVSHGYHLTHK